MKFYHIKDDYIAFLKEYDSKVAENKNERRPYIGVVLEIDDLKYYAPFTSPKAKHLKMKNTKDFRKISGGKLGAINFNNMIPVTESALIQLDISKEQDERYKRLLQNQYLAIVADQDGIKRTAAQLRAIIFKNEAECTEHERTLIARCCDLKKLEKIYLDYDK